MEKLSINRKKWLHGEEDSYLLRTCDGKKCCFGFLALKHGYRKQDITNVAKLDHLWKAREHFPKFVIERRYDTIDPRSTVRDSSYLGYSIMAVNDDLILSDREREKRIKTGFLKAGIKVTFTGSY